MARADTMNPSPSAEAVFADGFPNAAAKEAVMPQIGQFTRQDTGFTGKLETFTLFRYVVIVPADPSDAENAPDYRVHASDDRKAEAGPEIGAGWKRTGEKAGSYVSLLIDDPTLPQPIRANLFRNGDDESSWSLHWNRPAKRAERD